MRYAFGFYQLPPDHAAFCDFLLNSEPVLAQRHRSLPDTEELTFGPLTETLTPDGGVFLICRQADVSDVPIERFERWGKSWSTVEPRVAPVMTFSYEPLDRPVLYRCSLGAFLDYPDPATGSRKQKNVAFKKWAKSVVAWMKGRCTATCQLSGSDYPCTPAVAEAVKAGKVVLRN